MRPEGYSWDLMIAATERGPATVSRADTAHEAVVIVDYPDRRHVVSVPIVGDDLEGARRRAEDEMTRTLYRALIHERGFAAEVAAC